MVGEVEVLDSMKAFLEDDCDLTPEACYFVTKRLNEYYWDNISQEDIGDLEDDMGELEEDDEDGISGSEDDDKAGVEREGAHKEQSEESVEESSGEENGGAEDEKDRE